MRVVENNQMQLGELNISEINLDMKSRDDIPQILQGLQYLYSDKDVREKLFAALKKLIPNGIDANNGRPGMHLWQIFVLGTIRLNLNIDYDRLHSLTNEYRSIREMLGHSEFDKTYYNCQTLKDNVRLLTPEILDEINQIVVAAGHVLVKKKS